MLHYTGQEASVEHDPASTTPVVLASCGEVPAGAVVATVSASVNADCDNGTALQRQAYAELDNSRKKVLLRASLISTCQSPAASPLPLTGSYTYSTEVP